MPVECGNNWDTAWGINWNAAWGTNWNTAWGENWNSWGVPCVSISSREIVRMKSYLAMNQEIESRL